MEATTPAVAPPPPRAMEEGALVDAPVDAADAPHSQTERDEGSADGSANAHSAHSGEDESKTDEEQPEDGASTPPQPKTRRARLQRAAAVDESGTDSDRSPRMRRRGRPAKPKEKTKTSPESAEKAKRKGKGRARRKPDDGGSDDTPSDYVHVEVGDCVLLDSGDPDEHYVALVSSVQLSQGGDKLTGFTAQWYYKPDDVPEEVRATIVGGVLPNEVFLSPHKDKNSIDAVIGLCNVLPPEEYDEISTEIKRGFREKSHKPYYVCRFKFYPSRSTKKALERLKEEEVRGGLGPQKPKVGDEFQVAIPALQEKPAPATECVPWRQTARSAPSRAKQVWSRQVATSQESVFRQFRALLDTLRFAVGNVVKLYHHDVTSQGNVRCIVLKYQPSDSIQVCTSSGEVKSTLRGDLCSLLSEDVALQIFYSSRFNLTHTAHECTQKIIEAQRLEREAFKQEVLVRAQVAAQDRATQAAIEASNNRKRRK